MNGNQILIFCITVMFFSSCRGQKLPTEDEIEVTWELITNLHQNGPMLAAEFVITNNSHFTLDDKNWELYFNQTPRKIIQSGETSHFSASIKNISGDWYVMKPKPSFKLEPGQKAVISYQAEYWFIKETNAPCGLYFVFKKADDSEKIVEINNFKILPFERPEQMARGSNEHLKFPSPQNDYEAYSLQRLSLLPSDQLPRIIPSPKSIKTNDEFFEISSSTTIFSSYKNLDFEANYLKDQLNNLMGWSTVISDKRNENSIILNLDESLGQGPEWYSLKISEKEIEIVASTKKGVFYGIQSLISLIPVESFFSKPEKILLKGISVIDEPRFGHRGIHIDVARNFIPKENIKRAIDILAFYKINTLHLHLTDDEGWRLEIASLPELTSVGGHRGHTRKESAALHPAYGSGPHPYLSGRQGSGYFSRQDYIELLQYAGQRHIKVIPEINLPGHARAAIKAMEARYNFFISKGDEVAANEYRLIDPYDKSVYLSAQHYSDNVVNVARESTYRFLEKVIEEVVEIYSEANAPLNTIHIGGDEVPNGAWTKSPLVEEFMKQLPDIPHYENLHGYLTDRVLEIFCRKGLKMAGWEEIAMHKNNGQAVNPKFANGHVIPYVWNNLWGSQDLVYRLANRGYPVVLCHVTNFYFDLAYSNHPKEPGLYWGGFVNTRNAWYYNPFDVFKSTLKDNMGRDIDIEREYKGMERLKPEAQKNILGLQAQLWSETIQNPEMLEYYLLPKLIGFAESAWTKQRRWETTENTALRNEQVDKDWNIFANTIAQQELPRQSTLFGGYKYRVPPPGAKIENSKLLANVAFPGLAIHFTTDGNEPNLQSTQYKEPIELQGKSFKLKAFDRAGNGSRTIEINSNGNESIL